MIEVVFTEYFAFGGVQVGIRRQASDGWMYATGFDAVSGRLNWEYKAMGEYLTETVPGIKVEEDVLLALYQALSNRYQGSEDTRTIRADLLHERGRVDELMFDIRQIALESTRRLHAQDEAH